MSAPISTKMVIRARLRLFGRPVLTPGPDPHARPVDVPKPAHTLLAYLALHARHPIDRRKLAFVLWPDTPEATALRNLRQYLHRLRQILASLNISPDLLVSKGSQLQFNPQPAIWIDVAQFERQIADQRRQIEAIELYRDDLLAGFEAEWIHPFRARLRDHYLEALRNQIAIANMQRNYPRALHYAHRLLQATPMRESSHRIYMETLYYCGQRGQALRHFTHLKQMLRQTLNTEPMPQTVTLYRQIQTGALPRDLPPLISSSRRAPQTLQAITQLSESFVGRREELARLDEALAFALNGYGRFVLIEGESGIGKTRLLQTWRQARQERMLVFTAEAQTIDANFPCACMLEALARGAVCINWEWFPSAASWLSSLQTLLRSNNLREVSSDPSGSEPLSIDHLGQFILTLATRADKPVGILLDDLHAADESTWQLLGFLARRLAVAPLLIVGTCQPLLLPPLARRLLTSLRRHQLLESVELWPLSPDDTARLAAYLLQAGDSLDRIFTNHLYRLTEGNPFFITEYLKTVASLEEARATLISTLPPRTVQSVILSRLNRLPPYSQALLSTAAAIGHVFNFRVLVGVSPHLSRAQLLSVLEGWLEAGLVVETSDGYEFTHEQIQQVAYSRLDERQKKQTHREIARVLLTAPLEPRLRDPTRIAYHYLHSDRPEQALPDLLAAGKRAWQINSRSEALALAQQCLEMVSRSDFAEQVAGPLDELRQALQSPEDLLRAYAVLEKIVERWLER